MRGEFHAPAALPPGKSPRRPLNTKSGGPYSRSENRKWNPSSLSGSARRPVAISAEGVYRLSSRTVLDLINQECVAMFRNKIKRGGCSSLHIRTPPTMYRIETGLCLIILEQKANLQKHNKNKRIQGCLMNSTSTGSFTCL
jgi:hypothetical protein